ncbi:MAG: choice-of-anchor V domain-containing protein [Owenweeksia sp.]
MKRTILYSVFLGSAILISFDAMTNSSGAPAGSTGSPKSGNQTCARAGCHSGGPAVGARTVNISSDIPAAGFSPNTTYNFTVTANDAGSGNPRIGFQASVEGGGNHVGSLSTNGSNTLVKNGSFLGHSFNGITPTGGSRTWTFTWNSGNAPDQSVMYVAVNFANGNGQTTGDAIAAQTLTLTMDNSISIAEPEKMVDFSIAPNPARNWVNLEGLPVSVKAVKILDLSGKQVKVIHDVEASRESAIISLEGLSPGNYLVVPEGVNTKPQQLIIQ